MSATQITEPIVRELERETWTDWLDSVASWLDHAHATQVTFRRLVEEALRTVAEPHIRAELAELLRAARDHERKAEQLYRAIGREPPARRRIRGVLAALPLRARRALAGVGDVAGNAGGGWRHLRQLLFAHAETVAAFSTVEQLGLAMGLAEVVDIAFSVSCEKAAQHRLLKEVVLETAPMSILYKACI